MHAFKCLVNPGLNGAIVDKLWDKRQALGALALAAVIGSMPATVHAVELELPILVTINDVTVEEPFTGSRYAYFTVTLSEEPLQDVEIRYATAEDTAHEFEDYFPESGKVVFRGPRLDILTQELVPGETMKLIDISIKSDSFNDEQGETFFVN
ncbi:MAG: hypothetical protein ACRDGA_01870, partial [Bacteroidota bacterium]